ncbi:hypothetical protein [Aquimarina aquimarini]|uniref:hypothetical protein n=1 Tax=Aquimarina aquimarini TaxID=1191734 RepID=UPI000D54DF58|nr:hypothetical protein [Aquimarina aquimarini]
MKELFYISGLFYENQGYKSRKYLNIKLRTTQKTNPDLMVVMMNFGGSYPIDQKDNSAIETEANPDKTQDQIMKAMLNCEMEYARILNLSDGRDTKQFNLLKAIQEMDKEEIAHSIFDSRRSRGFKELFVPEISVLFGWGVDKRLRPLALKAIMTIGNKDPFGIRKEDTDYEDYHPSPYSTPIQKEWIEKSLHNF